MNATATASAATNNYGQLLATATSSQVVTAAAVAHQAIAVSSGSNSSSATGLAAEPMSSLPVIKPEIFLNDHSLVAVYCFVKNFIG